MILLFRHFTLLGFKLWQTKITKSYKFARMAPFEENKRHRPICTPALLHTTILLYQKLKLVFFSFNYIRHTFNIPLLCKLFFLCLTCALISTRESKVNFNFLPFSFHDGGGGALHGLWYSKTIFSVQKLINTYISKYTIYNLNKPWLPLGWQEGYQVHPWTHKSTLYTSFPD